MTNEQIDPTIVAALAGDQAFRLTPATMGVRVCGTLADGTPVWQPARHLLYISARIASALSKGNARLIVCMPPRHGKSWLLSICTPVWQLDRDPRSRILLASYGAELAEEFGQQARDIIRENQDILNCKLRKDSLRVDRFLTTAGGAMYSVGVGGALTGRGGNLLLIDDYIKNFEAALSPTTREKTYNWLISTALTRMEPNASVIIVATRWDVDDLIGRLLKLHPDVWEVIKLPAIAEENDPLGRQPGEALWPERYDVKALEAIKESMGTYWWQAEYQQDPLASMLGLVNRTWFPTIDVPPHRLRLEMVRHWDLASTQEAGDWTVGALIAKDLQFPLTYILDIQRAQLSPLGVENLVRATAERDGRDVKIRIEEEPGASGKAVTDHYIRDVLPEYDVKGVRATGPKEARARAFLAAAEAGRVRLLKAPWNDAMIEEFMTFPNGDHDDQVDAVCGGYNELYQRKARAGVWGRNMAQYEASGDPQVHSPVRGVVFGRTRYEV